MFHRIGLKFRTTGSYYRRHFWRSRAVFQGVDQQRLNSNLYSSLVDGGIRSNFVPQSSDLLEIGKRDED